MYAVNTVTTAKLINVFVPSSESKYNAVFEVALMDICVSLSFYP